MGDYSGGKAAPDEACGLYRMLSAGHTVEQLRELIVIPPLAEQVLREFPRVHPEEAH